MIILNEKTVEIKKFPNKEMLIETAELDIKKENRIEFKFEDSDDIVALMFIKNHLDSKGVESTLLIRYLPYSRMDRTEGHTIFTLKYLAGFINSLNFKKVFILEPHSDVSLAVIDRVEAVDGTKMLTEEVIRELNFDEDKEDYIFYPDAGAEKRYSKQINYKKTLTANKERDFKTGVIKRLTINGDKPTEPFRVIIVDDLCSRGGTFMLSAEKLKEMGATEIYLVVTHCEETIHDGDILTTDLIKKVYTTNSILITGHEKIEQYKVREKL